MADTPDIATLKQQARAGDARALQALRDLGFFAQATTETPLSAAQRRLWVIDRLMPGTPLYNIATALQLDGPLDRTALAAAVRALMERHEPLRSVLRERDGVPAQVVGPVDPATWREVDVADAPAPLEAARTLARREAATPFDLTRGPLLRATLVRIAPERHLLLCTMHHIVSDAWSAEILRRELAALYAAFATHQPHRLEPLRCRYRDVVRQQHERLTGESGRRLRDYWLRQLGGERTTLALPTDFRRPAVQTAAGRLHRFAFGTALSARLHRLAQENEATPFMVLVALVKTLLMRTTGQTDVSVGTPVAGRERVEWEALVGFFVNTVVLRDRVSPADTFRELLHRVRETCLGAYEHQAYPFDQLVEEMKLPRDFSRSPLFDVSVQLLDARPGVALGGGGLSVSEFDHGFVPAKCDLSFDFSTAAAGIDCSLTYHAELFTPARLARLEGHLRQLAGTVVDFPEARLGDLDLLTAAERTQLLDEFNAAPGEPSADTLVSWFARIAASQPEAVAVRCGAEERSYGALQLEAERLADALAGQGIGRETPVAVMLERGIAWSVTMLAVMQAGGLYLPVDASLPRSRIEFMLRDSGAVLVVTTPALAERAGLAGPSVPVTGDVVALRNPFAGPCDPAAARRARATPVPADAAYLIYTSGSTGQPKGVVVEHRGIANTIRDQVARLRLTAADRVLQFASASFDASLFEIWNAWLSGATLVVAPDATRTDAAAFLRLLRAAEVTVAVLPPSFVRSLEQSPLPLRLLFTAGEAAVPEDARHYAAAMEYVNGYGPTEASICSTVQVVTPGEDFAFGVPIGRPLANTRAYVLDGGGQLAPIGVWGELWVAGAGVARGYWRRPELTAERFRPDPWGGGRMYRTGDLCRWRDDGGLEFLGRADTQVKLRGIRIELGEIEFALARCAGVKEAAAVLRTDDPGRPVLVGYVVPPAGASLDVDALRAGLRERLPEHMIPAAIVRLEAMPLSPAGKVDRRQLPVPELRPAGAGLEPRNEVERAIAGILADVLRQPRLGVEDSFFQSGGNSLLAIQAIARLRDLLKVEVSVPAFFEAPTVAGLAQKLQADPAQATRVQAAARALARLAALTPEQRQQLLAQARAAAQSAQA